VKNVQPFKAIVDIHSMKRSC